MALPAGLRALGHRDFRLFWCGQLVSLIGTWMQSVGQSWLVLELTNSPFRLGLIGALQFGPILLFSFLSGAISDRVRKRRLLLGTQTALMLQAFTLAALVWSGHVQFWHVAVLAALYGLATTLDMPSRQAYIAHLVPRGDLMNAIALNSAVFNGARVVGPAVSGLLVARYGTAAAFVMNGLSFIAVIAALAAIRTEGAPSPRRGIGLRAEIAEGVRYAAGTPRVALVMSLLVAVSLFVVNMNVLVPLIARDVLHEGAHGFGLLMAALGLGAVAGSLAVAVLSVGRPPLGLVVGARGGRGVAAAPALHRAPVRRDRGGAGGARLRADRLHDELQYHRADRGARRAAGARDGPLRAGLRGDDADRGADHGHGGRALGRLPRLRGGRRRRAACWSWRSPARGGAGIPRPPRRRRRQLPRRPDRPVVP